MFFLGNEDKLYAGLRTRHGYPNPKTLDNCVIDFNRSDISFYLRGDKKNVVVSYHYEDESEYTSCLSVDVTALPTEQFYVNLFARVIKGSQVRFDLSAMTLSTDAENIAVSEFEAKFDENMPKLFRQISYYKANQDSLKGNVQDNGETLDIPKIHTIQARVHEVVDYSNSQLSRSLEETTSILSYVENQDFATKEMGNMLLGSLNDWLEETEKQYNKMNKDVSHLVAEMDAFNFDELFETTSDLLKQLNGKLEQSSEDFQVFSSFSKLVSKNLGSLESKRANLKNLPKMLKKMLKNDSTDKSGTMQTGLVLLLCFLGVFIIVALLSILSRLNSSYRKNILG